MAIHRLAHIYALRAMLVFAPVAFADNGGCDQRLLQAVRDVRETVESIQLDATAHARTGAPYGGVQRVGDARWVREQLQLIDQACVRGGEVEAAWRIEALIESLKLRPAARQRAADRCQAIPALSEFCSFNVAERGRRTVKVEPTVSRLSTSILPP